MTKWSAQSFLFTPCDHTFFPWSSQCPHPGLSPSRAVQDVAVSGSSGAFEVPLLQIPMEWRWPFCHKNEKKNMFWPWHRCVFLCLLFLATSRNNSNLVHLWIFRFSTDSSIRRICPGVQNEPVVTCHQACFGRANIPRLCFGTWSTRKRSDQSRDTLGHWSLDIGVQLSHIQLAKRHGWKICKSEHVKLMNDLNLRHNVMMLDVCSEELLSVVQRRCWICDRWWGWLCQSAPFWQGLLHCQTIWVSGTAESCRLTKRFSNL